MLVEIMVVEGCPHEEAAVDLVGTAARRLGVRPIVDIVEVASLAEAASLGYVGSPTIRVDGIDVAPPATGTGPAIGCRVYRTPRGLGGAPDLRLVCDALPAARTHQGP